MNEHPPTSGIRLKKSPGSIPEIVPMQRPEPRPGEVLVRVSAVGLCRTDLLVARDAVPFAGPVTLGHEFSGIVEAVGSRGPAVGTLVAVDPTFAHPDGRDGFMGLDIDGAMATWAIVPADKVHDAGTLSPMQAAYLEPVAAAMGGVSAARETRGFGAIVGDNRIAALTSAIFSSVRSPLKHDRLTPQELAEAAPCSYDWILESCITSEMPAQAIRALKPEGRLILKSRHLEEAALPVRDMVLKRISLIGRTRSGFPEAMRWLKAHPVIVRDLLGPTYPIERWRDAFAHAETGEGKKVFVTVGHI